MKGRNIPYYRNVRIGSFYQFTYHFSSVEKIRGDSSHMHWLDIRFWQFEIESILALI
jgi:hypothetical protein